MLVMGMGSRLPRGLLVVFEGIDGSGKTTQARLLAEALTAHGFEVVITKEPTNGPWGRKIRDTAHTGRLPPEEELVLFIEDRREHVRSVIAPSLAAGRIVVLDRYYLSTVAYQGARGMDPDSILALNEEFAPLPDVVFQLQVPPRVGLSRIAARGDIANEFEREENLTACARIFDSIPRSFIRRIDATPSVEAVRDLVLVGLYENPLAEMALGRSAPSSRPPIKNVEGFLAETTRIAHDATIAPGEKPDVLLRLLERFAH
jgi:dTMP kinase